MSNKILHLKKRTGFEFYRRVTTYEKHPIDKIFDEWLKKFEQNGVSEPKESINIIMSHVLRYEKMGKKHPKKALSDGEIQLLNRLCECRLARVPLQYIIGEWQFRNLCLSLAPPVFIPRPETETLVDLVLSRVNQNSGVVKICEIGCGSGAISLSLAHECQKVVCTAVDQSELACRLAKKNVNAYNLNDRVKIFWAKLNKEGKIVEGINKNGFTEGLPEEFDIVVSNPPYVPQKDLFHLQPEILLYEDLRALNGGEDGLDIVKPLLTFAARVLKSEESSNICGGLFIEIDPRHPVLLEKWLTSQGKSFPLTLHKVLYGLEEPLLGTIGVHRTYYASYIVNITGLDTTYHSDGGTKRAMSRCLMPILKERYKVPEYLINLRSFKHFINLRWASVVSRRTLIEMNCCLVIDGNSVAAQIYVREFSDGKRGRCAFGGDYDEYARAVKRFFERLTICCVRTIVVLDGGREPRKGKTHWKRLRGKISGGIKASPTNCSQVNLPLLLVPVFQWVAIQSKAIVAQCNFEADEEVAALARSLSCPILSFDSDFFLHNVPFYIPFPTLSHKLTQEQLDPDKEDRKQVDRYINCKVFNSFNFMNRSNISWNRKNDGENRSLHPQLLPLIAVLLGNDYVNKKTFSCFMSQIQLPKKCTKSARIIGLLQWLRSQESLDSAIHKILNHTKKGKRMYLEHIIKKTIDVYVGGESELYHTLNLSSIFGRRHDAPTSAFNKMQLDSDNEAEETLEQRSVEEDGPVEMEENDCDEEDTSDSEDSDSQSSLSDENFSEDEHEICLNTKLKQLPSWFLERYKRCELPPSFMDIMVRRVYLCSPQIEDASQPHSHQISFPILQAIIRLLTPDNDEPLSCWTRVGSKARILYLDPLPKQDGWPLMENLLQTPRKKLVEVILQALQLYSDDPNETKERKLGFNSIPSDWKILALSLAYWMRYSPGRKINERHLIAAIFTAVVLRVVDERAGPPGKSYGNIRKEKKRQYSEFKRQQRDKEDLTKIEQQSNQPVTCDDIKTTQSKCDKTKDVIEVKEKNVNLSVKQLISLINLGDCIAVSDNEGLISQMRQIDAGPKRRLGLRPSSFNGATVHAFAELQSVLLHVTHLNLLLGEPIAPSPLHNCFSGTLAYNAHYRSHSKSATSRKQIWRNLLGMSAPSLESLLEEFYLCVLRLAWGKLEDKIVMKKKRVKKKVKNKTPDASIPKEHTEDSENQKIYYDPGNKYSLLNDFC